MQQKHIYFFWALMQKSAFFDHVYFADSRDMQAVPDESVQLVITSPPYFHIKDYSKDGKQEKQTGKRQKGQIGDYRDYKKYLAEMLLVWRECYRVLMPNGKLVINVPPMPMLKSQVNTHYNRHIYDINSDIQQSILGNIDGLFLLDVFVWERVNPTKKLMFGSYPYPSNFYAQNTVEFMSVYVKDGAPKKRSSAIKEKSRLTQKEWLEFTKQVWRMPVPSRADKAYGKHSAIMPEEMALRFIKLYSFVGDVVLDPFAGSGTTLRVAKKLKRHFVGYEISPHYKNVISEKLSDE